MAATVAPRHHRIGKSEERSVIAALLPEPLHIQIEFPVEHRLEPLARDIALRVPINGVAHFHVVSRHALGDRSGRTADAEKPAHHLLPGADLRERPVPARIEIDPQRLRMRINRFLFHVAVEPRCLVADWWNFAVTPLRKPPGLFRQTQDARRFGNSERGLQSYLILDSAYRNAEFAADTAAGYVEPILTRMRQPVSGSADPCAVDQTLDPAGATQE
jgi:hypothetical protein